jgi:hypothetical protein
LSRTARAALTLYVLAPICGELLSGSTPVTSFVNPLTFLYLSGLYGSGALLVREIARARDLGWWGVLLLGAAYGVLEEGLVVTSWFNPNWPDARSLGEYGRLFDLNWVWATHLTLFHAVVSITAPIVIAEALFPDVASRPWLDVRWRRVIAIWLSLVSLAGLIGFGFLYSRDQGYAHPPASYVIAFALAVLLVRFALQSRSAPRASPGAVPSLWRLRLFAFALTVVAFALAWVGPAVIPLAVLTVAGLFALALLARSRIAEWSTRSGWHSEQRLALVSGALAFLIALQPVVELTHAGGRNATGQSAVALAAALFLAWLARRPRPAAIPAVA